ncbi:hypothetical protein TIFTF001_006294 [Ficus carica]|uniref:Uncharacterized protein n=1 Tax=Ficus carica TaxID=3494 RepID=A0AA88CVW0_FICCA|nr:hypothetical protein TIFTF001_006294 [Ficus carica]
MGGLVFNFNKTHKAIKTHKNIKIKSSCRRERRRQSSVAKCWQRHWATLSTVSWAAASRAGQKVTRLGSGRWATISGSGFHTQREEGAVAVAVGPTFLGGL